MPSRSQKSSIAARSCCRSSMMLPGPAVARDGLRPRRVPVKRAAVAASAYSPDDPRMGTRPLRGMDGGRHEAQHRARSHHACRQPAEAAGCLRDAARQGGRHARRPGRVRRPHGRRRRGRGAPAGRRRGGRGLRRRDEQDRLFHLYQGPPQRLLRRQPAPRAGGPRALPRLRAAHRGARADAQAQAHHVHRRDRHQGRSPAGEGHRQHAPRRWKAQARSRAS